MATIVWPAFPGAYVVDYIPEGGKEIDIELQGGGTYSVGTGSTPFYQVTIRCAVRTDVLAPAGAYQAMTEAAALEAIIIALKQGDVLQMATPINGVSRLWKLAGGSPPFGQRPDAPWYWDAELQLRSV